MLQNNDSACFSSWELAQQVVAMVTGDSAGKQFYFWCCRITGNTHPRRESNHVKNFFFYSVLMARTWQSSCSTHSDPGVSLYSRSLEPLATFTSASAGRISLWSLLTCKTNHPDNKTDVAHERVLRPGVRKKKKNKEEVFFFLFIYFF